MVYFPRVPKKHVRLEFTIHPYKGVSRHFIAVALHHDLRTMRRFCKSKGYSADGALACCWQPKNLTESQCVAEIHYARDRLTVDIMAHEAVHAAFSRAVLLGIPFDNEEFQEQLAQDAGILVEAIYSTLTENKVKLLQTTHNL
jgi:hypothetical protein